MQLPDKVLKEFEQHVLKDFPNEAVGLVINNSYRPCKNIHPEPTKHFRVSRQEVILSQNERGSEPGNEKTDGKLQALLHSHPYSASDVHLEGYRPEFPSASDIDHFNQWGIPWGIAATDGGGLSPMTWLDDNDRPPLHGRLFLWGVRDCYSLVRDWFWQERKINLYNVPREYGWWTRKESPQLFETWFEKAGFVTIPSNQVQIGDVALMRMGARHSPEVINHCGVITNHNELFHQGNGPFFSRACRKDHWQKSIAKYIRYTGAK